MEVAGEVAQVGRDPASDLVLNDPKCSRRHAVIEAAAEGIAIRDNGSANGVFVNGHKVERARLRDGDLIKLGDVLVTLLPDTVSGTMLMDGSEELAEGTDDGEEDPAEMDGTIPEVSSEVLRGGRPRPGDRSIAPVPSRPSPPGPGASTRPVFPPPEEDLEELPLDPGARTFSGRAEGRPLTVTVLAVLWAVSVPVYAFGGLLASRAASGGARVSLLAAGMALAVLSGAMSLGLWRELGWARVAQLAVAGVGLFLCPFSLASIAVLVYMLRPDVAWRFSDRAGREPGAAGRSEALYTGALVGAVALGVLLTAAIAVLARSDAGAPAGFLARAPAAERAAMADLQAMAAAQDAFRSVCNTGYGDLEALLRPGTVIPDYPAQGPAFLRGDAFHQPERNGYRFALTVEEAMPPAPGCPSRRYRRYVYTATSLGPGRSLAVGPDSVVHAAEGRAATLDDPPAQ